MQAPDRPAIRPVQSHRKGGGKCLVDIRRQSLLGRTRRAEAQREGELVRPSGWDRPVDGLVLRRIFAHGTGIYLEGENCVGRGVVCPWKSQLDGLGNIVGGQYHYAGAVSGL